MVGWQFWAAPMMFGVAVVGLGIGALGGNSAIILLLLLISCLTVILAVSRLHDYNKVSHDIEMRVVELIEGAPERVWIPRSAIEFEGRILLSQTRWPNHPSLK